VASAGTSAFRVQKYKHDPIPVFFNSPILQVMAGLHTIVLADDSSVIRRSVRRSLEQAGWTVCGEASNGREAIEKANRFHPQVVILDLSMPEMNGLEATDIEENDARNSPGFVNHARRCILLERGRLCRFLRRILQNRFYRGRG